MQPLIHRLHRKIELAAAERKLGPDNRHALSEAVIFLLDNDMMGGRRCICYYLHTLNNFRKVNTRLFVLVS